MVLYLIDGIYL